MFISCNEKMDVFKELEGGLVNEVILRSVFLPWQLSVWYEKGTANAPLWAKCRGV